MDLRAAGFCRTLAELPRLRKPVSSSKSGHAYLHKPVGCGDKGTASCGTKIDAVRKLTTSYVGSCSSGFSIHQPRTGPGNNSQNMYRGPISGSSELTS